MTAPQTAIPSVERKSEIATDSEDPRWQAVMTLPCQITVDLSLPGFTVSHFLALRIGSVVGTCWAVARDIPVRVNGAVIAWGELEAAGKRLAVRLTELA